MDDQATGLHTEVCQCIDNVSTWMQLKSLQPNAIKTVYCTSTHHQCQVPHVLFTVGFTMLKPVSSVHNLRIYLDLTSP